MKHTDKDFQPLPNKEAIATFNGKTLMTSWHYLDMLAQEHATAFTVAKMMDKDMLEEVYQAMQQAIENGTPFNDFQKRLKPYLMARGWWGEKVKMTDPKTNEVKEVALGSTRRLKTIFHTNKSTAYASGQWERIQKTKEYFPYLKYMPSVSIHKREEHKRYYNLVLPVEHEAWRYLFPPNDYHCRCWVKQLTKKQAEKEKISDDFNIKFEDFVNERTGKTVKTPIDIEPSFAHNHSRLETVLQLAEEKHGKTFAQKLRQQAMSLWKKLATFWKKLQGLRIFKKKYADDLLIPVEIFKEIFFSSHVDNGVIFNPKKFARIVEILKKQDVPFLLGEEGARFAKQMNAEAIYYPTEEGKSGFFAFPDNPTRAQVIEEIIHYTQHKKTGFTSLEWIDIVKLEIEAQHKLLQIGAVSDWTDEEIKQIERALVVWEKELAKLEKSNDS